MINRVCYCFRLGSTEILGSDIKSVLGLDSCNLSIASHEEVLCPSFFTFCRFSLFQKYPFFKVI